MKGVSRIRRDGSGAQRREKLRDWFRTKSRDFPWRTYTSPWEILLSEMMLLRTRADVVAKHAPRLMGQFPSPQSMARKTAADVEHALRPLGLRWRARSLHELATVLVSEHGGQVPLNSRSLMNLPGVGPYVAQATLSALTGQPVVLTDANTVRVATRVAGLRLEGDVRRRKLVQKALSDLVGGEAGLSDWLAVVDLAATICLPRKPNCAICPIHQLCEYGRQCLNRDRWTNPSG